MTLRILLDETGGGPTLPPLAPRPARHAAPVAVTLANGEPEDAQSVMLLTLYDQPEVGKRFRYQDLEWEIVEYRNGWLARLVVDDA